VGLHRQGGKALSRTLEQRSQGLVLGGNSNPERLFLSWIEQQAAIHAAFNPGSVG